MSRKRPFRMNATAIAVCLCAAPITSFAAGTGASVVGAYTQTIPGGIIATVTGVTEAQQSIQQSIQQSTQQLKQSTQQMQQSISQTLKQMDQDVTSQIKASREANQKLLDNQNKTLRNLFVQQAVNQAKTQAAINQSPANMPSNVCTSPTFAAGVQVGGKATRKVATDLSKSLTTYNTSWTRSVDQTDYINGLPATSTTAQSIMPQDGTISSMKDAQQYATLLTNPTPVTQMAAANKNTPAGKRYNAQVKVRQAQLAVPQSVISDVTAWHSPTVQLGDWANTAIASMSGNSSSTAKAPGVVNGNISMAALMRILVNQRFANPGWYSKITQENQTGLLREIALMDAARMRMQEEQLSLTQRIAVMLAQQTSAQIRKNTRPSINQAQVAAGGQAGN